MHEMIAPIIDDLDKSVNEIRNRHVRWGETPFEWGVIIMGKSLNALVRASNSLGELIKPTENSEADGWLSTLKVGDTGFSISFSGSTLPVRVDKIKRYPLPEHPTNKRITFGVTQKVNTDIPKKLTLDSSVHSDYVTRV